MVAASPPSSALVHHAVIKRPMAFTNETVVSQISWSYSKAVFLRLNKLSLHSLFCMLLL